MENLATSLKPQRAQEARELYAAGAREGGILSRQATEPMSTYLVRRQAWYQDFTDLDKELKLPEVILAERTLVNAGLTEQQVLLVRSALGGKITMDGVHGELIAQHSRLREREHRGRGFGYEKTKGNCLATSRKRRRTWTWSWPFL